jgi:hypothetical protein
MPCVRDSKSTKVCEFRITYLSLLFTAEQRKETMEVHGHQISIESRPTKKYIVRVAYLRNQMFSDPTNTDIDQENATALRIHC